MLVVISTPLPPNFNGPRSKSNFMELHKLLKSKVKEKRVFEYADISVDLQLKQLQDLKMHLQTKKSDPTSTKRSIKKLEHKVDFMSESIAKMLNHKKRLEEHIKHQEIMSRPMNRMKIVDNIWRDIQSTFGFDPANPTNISQTYSPGRCHLCGELAMHAADVCYTCNTK
jgi:myosin heavy subunit